MGKTTRFSFFTKLKKTVSSIIRFIFRKRKQKINKQKKIIKTSEYECAVYAFEDFEDMQEAIESEQFNVSTYYEMDGKSYIVVLADGTEDALESYGGKRVLEETFLDVFSTIKADTMYFAFDSEKYLMEFWKQVGKIYSKCIKVPTIEYGNVIYVDLSVFEKSLHGRITGMAIEYMGKQITDISLAQILEEYFPKVP